MIASLRGQVRMLRSDALIVDVGGIGYLVHVGSAILDGGLQVGHTVELYTHTHIRESELPLYGFLTLEELDLFHLLLGVTGIGPRTAQAILSTLPPATLRNAIAQGDVLALTRVPGVGRKTAQRLALELKEKVGAVNGMATAPPFSVADADVLNALTALGYSLAEAQTAAQSVPQEVGQLDQRILAALRYLGSR